MPKAGHFLSLITGNTGMKMNVVNISRAIIIIIKNKVLLLQFSEHVSLCLANLNVTPSLGVYTKKAFLSEVTQK